MIETDIYSIEHHFSNVFVIYLFFSEINDFYVELQGKCISYLSEFLHDAKY